jgi:hypothetical protein
MVVFDVRLESVSHYRFVQYRDLIESEIMFLSMIMSMSMDYQKGYPTPSPTS